MGRPTVDWELPQGGQSVITLGLRFVRGYAIRRELVFHLASVDTEPDWDKGGIGQGLFFSLFVIAAQVSFFQARGRQYR